MITVPAYTSESKIHGTGLFSSEKIEKGTVVWRFDPSTDIKLPKKIVDKWSNGSRKYIDHFCILVGKDYIYSLDNSIFINHSEDPNLESFSGFNDVRTTRDVEAGEELTTRYADSELKKIGVEDA